MRVAPETAGRLGCVGASRAAEGPFDLDLCSRLTVLNAAANELEALPDLSAMAELVHVGLELV